MENEVINKALSSKSVQAMAKRCRLTERDVWSIFYNSGADYLKLVKTKIKSKRILDRVFGDMLHYIHVSPQQAFEYIHNSPEYWQWWSAQFWSMSRRIDIRDGVELSIRLQLAAITIPRYILEKIFYGKQEFSSRKGTIKRTEGQKNQAASPKKKAGEKA